MKPIAALAALALLGTPTAALADWTPRQERIIKAANEILEADLYAFPNSCKVLDGKARHAAGVERLKAMLPALEKALSSWAVYEIFVLRAPTFGPGAIPPKRCKTLKLYAPEPEAKMARYEAAVAALAAAVEAE
jgi:hypothetical protein